MKKLLFVIMVFIPLTSFSQQPTDLLYAVTAKQMAQKQDTTWDEGYATPVSSFPIVFETNYMYLDNSFPQKHYKYQADSQWKFRGKSENGREFMIGAVDPEGQRCALILTLKESTNFNLIIMYPEKASIYSGFWKYK